MELEAFQDFDSVNGVDLTLDDLPDVWPHFSISALPEKPQDPIMDTVRLWGRLRHVLPLKLPISSIKNNTLDKPADELVGMPAESNIWTRAATEPRKPTNLALSWDLLAPSAENSILALPLLSQRSADTFSAARHLVNPDFHDVSTKLLNTTPAELFHSLCISLAGVSSPLFVWDPAPERFFVRGEDGKNGILILLGMDRVVSQSVVQRFLTIGTLTRRLEGLVSQLQQSRDHSEPCLHACAHALSSVLQVIRKRISWLTAAWDVEERDADLHTIFSLWTACATLEYDLTKLASLFSRDISYSAQSYNSVPTGASELLSAVYNQLNGYLDNLSSRTTSAIFAYLLTAISANYFDRICHSVGYGTRNNLDSHRSGGPMSRQKPLVQVDDEDEQDANMTVDDGLGELFPCFFSKEFTQALLRARRSLRLLQSASPDHPFLTQAKRLGDVRWFWTEREVEQAWLHPEAPDPHFTFDTAALKDRPTGADSAPIVDVLDSFKRFDLEPGSELNVLTRAMRSSTIGFDDFLVTFPLSLPSLTPSLSSLSELILSPLVAHISSLSSTLVGMFLAHDGYLSLQAHLQLLRSYVLLTSQAFRSRLQSALFSDDPAPSTATTANAHAMASQTSSFKRGTSTAAWVIGLSPELTGGDWPPTGADVSYYLRTVVIDALDSDHPERQLREHGEGVSRDWVQVIEEAEWRLGFAIRDLPTGSGHAKWLNPKAIEALDFLYMDYQPPQPLDVVISSSTLSKYHRLFAFNLRLMRVENTVNALFRMTTKGSDPPFSTLAQSQKLFLNFRFFSSSFISSLSSYVYDDAIGNMYDAFLQKLEDDRGQDGKPTRKFTDVFALEDYHSRVMDDILSSCLLRSNQKAVGDLLRSVLDIILQFGNLMADRARGELEEYQAAGPLEDLFDKFIRRLGTFVKVLRSLIDKGVITSRVPVEDMPLHASTEALMISGSATVGVTANLHNLLVRLDVSQWWTRSHGK